jgi:hypothetical protein
MASTQGLFIAIFLSSKIQSDFAVDFLKKFTIRLITSIFRLIIFSTDFTNFPSFFQCSKFYCFNQQMSIHHNLKFFYKNYLNHLSSPFLTKNNTQLIYASAVILSSIWLNNFLGPYGFFQCTPLSDSIFQEIIEFLSSNSNIPLRNFKSILTENILLRGLLVNLTVKDFLFLFRA